MSVDLTPLWQSAVTIGALALSAFGSLALQAAARRFHVQMSAEQSANFDTALNKALTLGVVQADSLIRAKGWDSADVKSTVLASALQSVVDRFPGALKGVGLTSDVSDPHNRQIIIDALARAFPAAVTAAAASPATPPAPPAPVAIVSPVTKEVSHA